MKRYFIVLLFVLIILLSLFPRSVEVINGNPLFEFDQGREMLAAKHIVVDHKLILIGTEVGAGMAGISGIFHGPMYYYMLTVPFVLSNGNPAAETYLMLFFGLLTVLFGFFFGKKIFGIYGGILLSLLIAISPVFIAQSRFLWSPNPPTLFILLSFYFTYLAVRKNNLYIFLSAFFAAFVYNFELGIAVPLSISLFLYSLFIFRRELKNYLYLFLGFLIGYIPMILFEVRHGFMGTKSIISYLTNHTPHPAGISSGIHFLIDHFNSFVFNFKDTFPIDNTFNFLFLTLIILISIYFLIKEKNKDFKYFFSYLIFLIPVTFLIFAPLKNTVWGIYLLHLNLVYVLLFSYIVYSVFRIKDLKLITLSVLVISILTLNGINNSIKVTSHDIFDYGGTAKLNGKMDAIDYIYKDAKGKPFGLLVFTPPVYTYPYDYLLWWYGERKYHYIPYNEKKGTFYLLIQTDAGRPWTYKGWLQTVIKTGKIESTVTLPSGFIVQKRVANE